MPVSADDPDLYLNISWDHFKRQNDFQLSNIQAAGNTRIKERLKGNIACKDQLYIYQLRNGDEIKVSSLETNYDGYLRVGSVRKRCHLFSTKRYTVKNGKNELMFNVIKDSPNIQKCVDEQNNLIATMTRNEIDEEKVLVLNYRQTHPLSYFSNLILVVAVLVYSDYYSPNRGINHIEKCKLILVISTLVALFIMFIVGTTSFGWL